LTDFREILNIEFHNNPSSGSWLVACKGMDRHDKGNSCFAQFCERA